MQDLNGKSVRGFAHCKCGLCDHEDRMECIAGKCYCCDLEDAFSILSHHDFEPPQSKIATEQKLQEFVTA